MQIDPNIIPPLKLTPTVKCKGILEKNTFIGVCFQLFLTLYITGELFWDIFKI